MAVLRHKTAKNVVVYSDPANMINIPEVLHNNLRRIDHVEKFRII